jgi:flagellar hook protein FlgE
MGSNFQYGLVAGFRAVTAWQQNILRNAQGMLKPGYNRITLNFDGQPSEPLSQGALGTASTGGRNSLMGGGDSLRITGATINFKQGELQPAESPTQLAIKGDGFFLVAENLAPGAKVFLTRAGDFRYDASGRLVNSQGLFVVGGSGTLTDPPTPVTNPGDGSVDLTRLTLGRVGSRSGLATAGYGDVIYQATVASGGIQAFANGRPEVGFVQSQTLEMPDRVGAIGMLQVESAQAQQTYKMFKDMLDNFNKSTDDAIGLVR